MLPIPRCSTCQCITPYHASGCPEEPKPVSKEETRAKLLEAYVAALNEHKAVRAAQFLLMEQRQELEARGVQAHAALQAARLALEEGI